MNETESVKIEIISNACSTIEFKEFKILLDPWAVGLLYNGAWACYPTPRNVDAFLDGVTHVFISHIHEDHCDPETLKKLPKTVTVIIPDIYPNHVLRKSISEKGFTNIVNFQLKSVYALSDSVSLKLIPPLNSFGQETGLVPSDEEKIAIDTGVLIKCGENQNSVNILALPDNAPYDLPKYKEEFGEERIDILLFSYNGFAQDYPLCYDNLSFEEKRDLSLNMALKGEGFLLKFLEAIKPKYLIPFSADFALLGKRSKEFFEVHSGIFLHKDKYAERIENLTKIKSFAIYEKDALRIDSNDFEYSRNSSDEDRRYYSSALPSSQTKKTFVSLEEESLTKIMFAAGEHLFKKTSSIAHKISPWIWEIKVIDRNLFYSVNWDDFRVSSCHNQDAKKILTAYLTEEQLVSILMRDDHWNNAQIGCYLTWSRVPNEYNHYLYDAINFFHLG